MGGQYDKKTGSKEYEKQGNTNFFSIFNGIFNGVMWSKKSTR